MKIADCYYTDPVFINIPFVDPKELQEMSSKLQDTPHHMTNGYTQPQDTNMKSSTHSSKSLISRTSYTSVCSNGFCQLSEGFGCGRCRVQSEGSEEESNHECINTANRQYVECMYPCIYMSYVSNVILNNSFAIHMYVYMNVSMQ